MLTTQLVVVVGVDADNTTGGGGGCISGRATTQQLPLKREQININSGAPTQQNNSNSLGAICVSPFIGHLPV